MCRLWFSAGAEIAGEKLNTLKTQLDKLLEPGGPDHQSIHSQERVIAYHSRLAIQGLNERSNQPFVGKGGSILVFNGEILNWKEILENTSFEGKGQNFESDTQFLAYILDEKIIEQHVSSFRGFFAFVYYDPEENRIIAGRDCFGVKPLYVTKDAGNGIAFASTSEALACHPDIDRRLDCEGFAEYMKYGFFPFGNSAFDGIRQFPAGKLISYKLDRQKEVVEKKEVCSFTPFDIYKKESKRLQGEKISSEVVLSTLIESCKLRALSDVPISLFLSGGIDSSLLALVYSKFLDINPECFTLKFDKSEDGDESEIAILTAKKLGLSHNIVPFDDKDITDSVEKVFLALDQPFVDTSIIPSYILCQKVSSSFKVAISADGGDEAYAGYPKYQRHKSIYSKISKLNFLPREFFNGLPLPKSFPQQIQKLVSVLSTKDRVKAIYFLQHQIWSNERLDEILKYGWANDLDEIMKEYIEMNTTLSSVQYLDIIFYMLDDILYKIDRASMACGLELREPMLDQKFVAMGLSIPDEYKLRGNYSKVCLRELVDSYLPHVSQLPKKGFGIPLDLLYKSEFMKDTVSDAVNKNSILWNILNKSKVESLLESEVLTDNQEWQLRSLLVWCKTHNI